MKRVPPRMIAPPRATDRRRRAAAAAVCCCGAILLLPGCNRRPAANVFVDPALATLVPTDTVFVAGARMQQLSGTPFFRQYAAAGKVAFFGRFARDTGVDLRKNVWEVLAPYDGRTLLVMMRGRFAEMGMEPRIEREGARRLGYKGYTILGDERMAVLFLNPTTAVAGPFDSLKRLLDNRDRGSGMPARLAEKLRRISSAHQVFFAGDLGASIPEAGAISGGIDLRSGVQGRATLDAGSADEARRWKESLRGRLTAARLRTPEKAREQLRVYDGIELNNDASAVEVRVELGADLLDEALALALEKVRP